MSVLAAAPLADAGGGYAFLAKWGQYPVVVALTVMTGPFLWLRPKSLLRRSLGWVGPPLAGRTPKPWLKCVAAGGRTEYRLQPNAWTGFRSGASVWIDASARKGSAVNGGLALIGAHCAFYC